MCCRRLHGGYVLFENFILNFFLVVTKISTISKFKDLHK